MFDLEAIRKNLNEAVNDGNIVSAFNIYLSTENINIIEEINLTNENKYCIIYYNRLFNNLKFCYNIVDMDHMVHEMQYKYDEWKELNSSIIITNIEMQKFAFLLK